MKILHVITSLRTGGAEKLMTDLLPRMWDCGEEVELCVFDGERTPFYEELEKKEVKIYALSSSVYSLVNLWKLIWLVRKYDVVHSHNTACQYYVAIASLLTACRVFTTEHNTTNRRRGKWWRLVDRWMYGRYDKIVCISELVKDNLCRHIGSEFVKKCMIIHNGIDVKKFMVGGGRPVTSDKTVLMVSAFRKQKDQKTLIKAMSLLPPSYQLQLAGTGEECLIEDCKNLVKELGLAERVMFLGMRMDVDTLFKAAHVIVLSSHYEGLSLSSLEGMASGRPFIASDVDGLRDIVGGYGVLFPHEDYKALADEIRKVCEDEEYAEEVAVRCQERAKMFDISVMVEKYMDVYFEKPC